MTLHAMRRRIAHGDRDLPEPRDRVLESVREEALLANHEAPVAQKFTADDRNAGLVEVRPAERAYIPPRGFGEGAPEIGLVCASPLVFLEVREHAAAEGLGAEPCLHHFENALPLLIDERVDGGEKVRDGPHRLPDGASGEPGVLRVGLLRVGEARDVGVEFGIDLHHDLVAHPLRERFVEPEIVPPLHGHEISEPHVRQFVGRESRERSALGDAHALRVEEKILVGVRDGARVLHRTVDVFGDGEKIEFVERIAPSEIALQAGQDRREDVDDGSGETALPLHGHDAGRDGSARHGREFEVANRDREQIRRERRRFSELDDSSRAFGSVGHDRRVGDRLLSGGDGERHLIGNFHRGFIEAGKPGSGVARFELSEDVPVVGPLHSVDRRGAFVEVVRERDLEGVAAGGDLFAVLARGFDKSLFVLLAGAKRHRPARTPQSDRAERHFLSVKGNVGAGGRDGEIDAYRAGVEFLRGIEIERDRLSGGAYAGGEALDFSLRGGGHQAPDQEREKRCE